MFHKFIALFLAALCILTTAAFAGDDKGKESAFDRVVATKTIRCAYLPYEPFIKKDLVTGHLSGIIVDYMNEIARKQGFQIDWAGEINIDQIVLALNAKRFDAFCVPSTPDSNWAEKLGFEASLGGLPYYIYVPFQSKFDDTSLAHAKFAVVDGYALTEITKEAFPHAQYVSLPQTTSTAEMYDQLRYKKADAHINEQISASNYMKNNPDVIRRYSDKPVMAPQMFLITAHDDQKIRDFIQKEFDVNNAGNAQLMSKLLETYHVGKGSLLVGEECHSKLTPKGKKMCDLDKNEEAKQ